MGDKSSDNPIQGTREWAVATVDCSMGCPHGCRYCYARYDQVYRKKLLLEEQWNSCRIVQEAVDQTYPQYDGQVMFPAHHDIIPENLNECLTVIGKLLTAGNRVLIVSKPHISCIKSICDTFKSHTDKLLFRFTITARDAVLLDFWEPGAPDYMQRLSCLQHAYKNDFKTSVSIEPMLDSADVVGMVKELLPFVTHSIWLGKMNKVEKRVQVKNDTEDEFVKKIIEGQQQNRIVAIYEQLKDVDLIRWKESIKDIIGLERAERPGLDR